MLRIHIYYIASFLEKLITTVNHGWLRIVEPIDSIFYEMICNVHFARFCRSDENVWRVYHWKMNLPNISLACRNPHQIYVQTSNVRSND